MWGFIHSHVGVTAGTPNLAMLLLCATVATTTSRVVYLSMKTIKPALLGLMMKLFPSQHATFMSHTTTQRKWCSPKSKEIEVKYVDTKHQIADVFTKPLDFNNGFKKFSRVLHGKVSLGI